MRSMLYEYGVVAPKGRKKVVGWVGEHRAQIEQKVPAMVVQLMDQQLQALRELDERIVANEQALQQTQRADATVRELLKVPGIGPLGATALRAELGDASAWKSSREFACCRGLVPRHTGTGGKVRMAGISKRGDPYLRTLLIHGARNLVRGPDQPQWIADMLLRRPFNVVAVAVAHKLARIAWSIVARGEKFDPVRAFGTKPMPA
jgi:transposase